MNTFTIFFKNDIKIIFRDKTLILMFCLPIILILVCRIFVPYIAGFMPKLDEYYWIILSAFCVLSGSTPAFLTAFLMLDEKDENLIPVLRVSPLPYSRFVGYRIVFLMLFSFAFSILFLLFNGLLFNALHKIILISVLVSFIPALLVLLLVPYAKNKIEGVSLFKGVNVILFIPLIAFFIPAGWKIAFWIIPFYWVYDLLHFQQTNLMLFGHFLLGLIINLAWFYLLRYVFIKKQF